MKTTKLLKRLLALLWKYGNVEVDIITEDSICQTEYELGEVAYSPKEKRIKLLSKGFT